MTSGESPEGILEKAVAIDPVAAEWARREATMIEHEGNSALDVARFSNREELKLSNADWAVKAFHYAHHRILPAENARSLDH